MRANIRQFVTIVAENIPIHEPIYEFGSFQVPGQEELADLRPIFPGREYVGTDMREGPGVDKILDLHSIDLPSESVGTVLCLDTLEHVEQPRLALQEIHRILSPCGLVVISSVMDFPIHDNPSDYWRFTPDAFKSILKPFKESFVGFAGKEVLPHTVVGVGFKGEAPDLSRFMHQYHQWQVAQKYHPIAVILQLTPPIMLPLLQQTYRAFAGIAKAFSRRPKNRG